MKILGIVGSRRKLGNSEILAKEALKTAQEEGTSIGMIRLSDLDIEECNGCVMCLTRGEPCHIKDERDWFFKQVDGADGLIVTGPSYHGWVPSSFMRAQHRVGGYRQMNLFAPGRKSTKKAITICVAGDTRLAGAAIPALNVFVHRLGFEPLESFLAGSQGPGEVLLSEREVILQEVRRAAHDLVFALRGVAERLSDGAHKLRIFNWRAPAQGEQGLVTEENCCPFCFGQAVTPVAWFPTSPLEPGEAQCAYCHYSKGQIAVEDGKVTFNLKKLPDEVIYKDWEARRDAWHKGSAGRWQERKEEVITKRNAYKELIPWLSPKSEG